MVIKNAKCSQLFTILEENNVRFLSDRLVTNQFIAASVMSLDHVTTIKSLFVETFPGLSLERSLLLLGQGGEFSTWKWVNAKDQFVKTSVFSRPSLFPKAQEVVNLPWCNGQYTLWRFFYNV